MPAAVVWCRGAVWWQQLAAVGNSWQQLAVVMLVVMLVMVMVDGGMVYGFCEVQHERMNTFDQLTINALPCICQTSKSFLLAKHRHKHSDDSS